MALEERTSPKKIIRWLWIALLVVLLGALDWGIQWATYTRPPLDEALAVERQVVHKVSTGKHQREGIMAFLEKRKPDFSTDPD